MSESVEKIKRIAISCSVEYCGFKYYENRYFFDRIEGGESFLTTEIPFSVFKNMGVTKPSNYPIRYRPRDSGNGMITEVEVSLNEDQRFLIEDLDSVAVIMVD